MNRTPLQLPTIERRDCFLMWVGKKYYPTPTEFLTEARALGLSKRIPLIPHGLRIGVSRLFLMHSHCPITPHDLPSPTIPGCFAWATITGIEIIISDDVDPAQLERDMNEAGIEVTAIPVSQAAREPKRGCGHRTVPGSIYLVTKGDLTDVQHHAIERTIQGLIHEITPPIPYYGKSFRGLKRLTRSHTELDIQRWASLAADVHHYMNTQPRKEPTHA
jgi:hypothetical protein